jgi:hypothetical protein
MMMNSAKADAGRSSEKKLTPTIVDKADAFGVSQSITKRNQHQLWLKTYWNRFFRFVAHNGIGFPQICAVVIDSLICVELVSVFWCIWRHWNDVVFNGATLAAATIRHRITEKYQRWCVARLFRSESFGFPEPFPFSWRGVH